MLSAIETLIPHRAPMRFIDALTDCTETTASATANFCAEHFAVADGAVLETAGQTLGAGSVWALAQDSAHLDPAAAQGLNVLGSDAVATNTAGLIVFGIAADLAILSSRRLPSWLGWMAIAMAVVVVTPAEALSFIALAIWMVILSILMWPGR